MALATSARTSSRSSSEAAHPISSMITLTPKGRFVSARVLSMRVRTTSGDTPLTPRTPKPPASETAATRSTPATDPIPAERIGTSIPSSSQSGVRSGTGMQRL
jgi:hypothetical protein